MKSIQRNFERITKRNPGASSYINFAIAITDKRFSRDAIARWFKKLVDKEDYCRAERMSLMEHLYLLSNPLEENEKQAEN